MTYVVPKSATIFDVMQVSYVMEMFVPGKVPFSLSQLTSSNSFGRLHNFGGICGVGVHLLQIIPRAENEI